MARNTDIGWQQGGGTLNAIVGCSPVSPGCANCYATGECHRKQSHPRLSKDFEGTVRKVNRNLVWTGQINFIRKRLYDVLDDHGSRCWFVNSLSDQFHENLPDEELLECFSVFNAAYWQEFRILTKRQDRLLRLDSRIIWTPNIWMGVSVEDVGHLHRIATLGKTGAQHKFISFEPWLTPDWSDPSTHLRTRFNAGIDVDGKTYHRLADLLTDAGNECCIVGGESDETKIKPRPLALDDVRYILEQTSEAHAHPVLKQLGTRWAVGSNTYNRKAKGAHHGSVKEYWPEEFQQYSTSWPFLDLPKYTPDKPMSQSHFLASMPSSPKIVQMKTSKFPASRKGRSA